MAANTWPGASFSQAPDPGEGRPGPCFGEADRPATPLGGMDADAASWTIESEDDHYGRATKPGETAIWNQCLPCWDGAGVPGGASPRPEPGAGSAGRGAALI
jgi:hypothetical protein